MALLDTLARWFGNLAAGRAASGSGQLGLSPVAGPRLQEPDSHGVPDPHHSGPTHQATDDFRSSAVIDLVELMRCTGATKERAQPFLDPLNKAMAEYEINRPNRIGMFLANVGHESGGLKWLVELWGPTAAQLRYEGRQDLGNNQQGDGFRFRGRGLLQTTGRANYRALTERMKKRFPDAPDFTSSPELVSHPKWATLSACDYVAMRKLNALADRGAFVDYVKGINGGTNGMTDRLNLWNMAREVLK